MVKLARHTRTRTALLQCSLIGLITVVAVLPLLALNLKETSIYLRRTDHRDIRDSAAAAIAHTVLAAPKRGPPYTLTICTIVHNEGRYLLEWVLYHYLVGIEHFFIYDNESDDGSRALLQPLIDGGLVTYLWWPGEKGNAQGRQNEHCFNATHVASLTRWMVNFDIDEFLVVVGYTLDSRVFRQRDFLLHAYLREYEEARCGGVLLDRLPFSANGHRDPPAGLVIEEYTQRSVSVRPDVREPHMIGKVLASHRGFKSMHGHSFTVSPGWSACFADQTTWNNMTIEDIKHRVYEPLRLHHYMARSYNECIQKIEVLKVRATRNWRVQHGPDVCNRAMDGNAQFTPSEHTTDRTLTDSILPSVVRALLPHFKQHS